MTHPQKKYYRQRAHANPLSDHSYDYPLSPELMDWLPFFTEGNIGRDVEMVDVGCGYGGLLVGLGTLYPDSLSVGFELRVKVSDYVRDRIKALREENEKDAKYGNIAVIRANAMKHLTNFFHKGQLSKMFFLFPDPHFKKEKRKWRIISPTLLSEYAYLMKPNGRLYTVTDVPELFNWMQQCLNEHPLFQELSDEDIEKDPVVPLVMESTEEGKKVARNKGVKLLLVYVRL